MIKPWLANGILVLAVIAWTANFVLSIFVEDYKINESVNSVFLAIITGVIATRVQGARDTSDQETHQLDDHTHHHEAEGHAHTTEDRCITRNTHKDNTHD